MSTPTSHPGQVAFTLKKLSRASIDAAMQKAERYRLLNDPLPAESICMDILAIDPDNQQASKVLLLALTDQFSQLGTQNKFNQAIELTKSFKDDYSRLYYMGIINERQGTSVLNSGNHGCEYDSYEWLIDAMEFYEQSEAIRVSGNDESVLRWNTCARIIMDNNLGPRPKDNFIPILE
ncbi:MAG: hypothetical protein RIF36_13420 [Imperialibacter sp.]|uniref:hypothetical protein n=1 Tax=Imperialibacter sp. TaxID=2038411 RepID=UPI0032EF234A